MDAAVCSSIFVEAREAADLLLGPALPYIGSSALVFGRFWEKMFLTLFYVMV